jgi:RNA polymerase sigma-70 factor (sigma-E family)
VTFEEYVDAYLPRLSRFAAVLAGDRSLAEDVLQTVLARACAQWERVAAADSPHAYVRRMLVNEYLSWRRRRQRVVLMPDLDGLAQAMGDYAEQYAQRVALLQLVQRLPARQRAAVVLRYYEDLDDRQIAAVLGCTVSTVRSNIARALATLRVRNAHATRSETHR